MNTDNFVADPDMVEESTKAFKAGQYSTTTEYINEIKSRIPPVLPGFGVRDNRYKQRKSNQAKLVWDGNQLNDKYAGKKYQYLLDKVAEDEGQTFRPKNEGSI
jgi:hypothetical protein